MTTRLIGAHVSASGGVDKAIQRAYDIGCNAVQVFSGSPRVWAKPALDKHPVEQMFAEQERLGIHPIMTHALYLVNLASDKPESVEKSIKSLIYELQFDSLVKGGGVIVHLGSHQGRGWETVKEQVAKAISTILEKTPENSTFLIENSAGQNGKLSSDLSEIRWLMDQVKSPRLGWCFDTCHAHAAGYKLSPIETMGEKLESSTREVRERGQDGLIPVENVIEELNLWSTLKCIHTNDSRDDFDSGKDRHANIGDGKIPAEDLAYFLHLKQLTHIPLILEVPGIDGNGPDAENVARLKKILE